MGDLSEHFSRSEFGDNTSGMLPDGMPDPKLVRCLEALRELVGKPIVVTSGWRDPEHNLSVGGAPSTPIFAGGVLVRTDPDMHMVGKAADISWDGMVAARDWPLCRDAGFTGVGVYLDNKHLHVDVRDGDFATWTKQS